MQPPAAPLDGETCPGLSSWDATPPRRPGLREFNGAALENDDVNPPLPGTHPTAALLNMTALQIIALCKVVPNAVMSIAGGAIASYSGAPSSPTPLTFTVAQAAGVCTIIFPNATFPSPIAQPVACLAGILGAHTYAISAAVAVGSTTTTVTVYTGMDATPTNLDFTVALY